MKNVINQKAREYDVIPQFLYSLYGMEQLLKKISHSPYKDYFVVKGGFLLASTYGLSNRSTRDLDATIRNMELTEKKLNTFIEYITAPDKDGESHFQLRSIKKIRDNFDYDGFNIRLIFSNGRGKYPIDLDLTTGEHLIQLNEKQPVKLIFEEGTIDLPTYPIEQILADKLYTTLAYGSIDDSNSRSKDLYDIYFLTRVNSSIDYGKIKVAMEETMLQRDFVLDEKKYEPILDYLYQSKQQKIFWYDFQKAQNFARDIAFDDVMVATKNLASKVTDTPQQQSVSDKIKLARKEADKINNTTIPGKEKNKDIEK